MGKSIKLTRIFTGFWNYIFKRRRIEKLAEDRMKICLTCDFIDLKGSTCYAPGTEPCCGICGCSLKLKLRVKKEVCPANEPKW